MVSDWNNALKAGFDVEKLCWPSWLLESDLGKEIEHCLPKVMIDRYDLIVWRKIRNKRCEMKCVVGCCGE